jgi:hypothetical protein
MDELITLLGEEPEDSSKEESLRPEWANPPSLEDLKNDLTQALGDHDTQTSKIDTYLDNLYITGSAKLPPCKTNSTLQLKLIRKGAEWRYAALSEPFLSTPDVFNLSPIGPEDVLPAKYNEAIINNQFNTQLDKVKFIDDYVHTCVDEGTVIVRTGWEYEEELVVQTMQDPYGNIIEMEVPVTTKNQPSLEVCKYTNVIIDPTCEGVLDNASFIIYKFESSLSDLEKSGKYTNLDNVDATNNSPLGDDDNSHYQGDDMTESFSFSDRPRKKLDVYEYWGYWDIDGSGMTKPIVATWIGTTMIRLEENPFPDKKPPFVVVPYMPIRRSVYGEPDGVLTEDNQKVMGAVSRGIIDIMAKSANGQTAHMKGALDITNKRKFLNGEDYEFNPGTDPRSAIYMHQYPEVPQSATMLIQMMQQEADALTGIRPFNNDQSDLSKSRMGGRKTIDAASKRENAILRRLAAGMRKIAQKIIAMNQEFLDDETAVKVSGSDEFIQVPREQLLGKFDVNIDISTVETDNEKAEELSFMLQTLGNTMPMDFSQIVLAEIAQLRKMPALAQKIATYQPPPPSPMEQQMQQLQMMMTQMQLQLMQMDAYKKQTEAAENEADIQLKTAKAQSEYVNQGLTQSETDINNLVFLDKESGVEHDRDIDKIKSQARAQTEMKIVEAGLEVMKARKMPKQPKR